LGKRWTLAFHLEKQKALAVGGKWERRRDSTNWGQTKEEKWAGELISSRTGRKKKALKGRPLEPPEGGWVGSILLGNGFKRKKKEEKRQK